MEPKNSSNFKLLFSDHEELNITEISNSYTIQLIEEKRRLKKKLNLQYYFDSYDLVNLIQGAMAYETNMGFDYARYQQDHLQNLIYSFVFLKLYLPAPIKMLEPHKIEFFNKIYRHSIDLKSPKNQEENKGVVNDVLYLLDRGTNNFQLGQIASNIDSYVNDLVQSSPELLRIDFLLKEFPFWKGRLKYLQDNEIIELSAVKSEFEEIKDDELFRVINSGFEQARPGRIANNFYDSLAFYHLQELLNKYNEDSTNNPLPVFFASSPVVRRAIEIIRNENPFLFSYEIKDIDINGSHLIPIVRDALYFVLEPIFTVNDGTEVFFKNLQDSRPLIRKLIQEEYSSLVEKSGKLENNFNKTKRRFEESIREIIEIKLTQEIWIKNKAYESLAKDLKDLMDLTDFDLKEVEEKIDAQLIGILQSAQYSLERSRQLGAILGAYRSVDKDVEKILRQNFLSSSINIYRDFALIRFGIDQRKLPQLQQLTEALIEDSLDSTSPALYNILSSLSTKIDNPQKAERFLQGIVVSWLLEKYNLIIELCSQIDPLDMQNRYETALIYAGAYIACYRNKKGVEETQKIINCILSKKDQNYKVWIGIAYLYYRMLEIENNKYREIPEMNSKNWESIINEEYYNKFFINGALLFIKKAYNFIKEKRGRRRG